VLSCETTGDASVEQVQVCNKAADCANAPGGATSCCAILSYHACLSSAVASFAGLTCL
jgi:hypothetical protein